MSKIEFKTATKNMTVDNLGELDLLFQAKIGFQVFENNKRVTIITGALATSRRIAIKKVKSEFLERISAIYQGDKLLVASTSPISRGPGLVTNDHFKYWVDGWAFDDKSVLQIPAYNIFTKFSGEERKDYQPNDGSGLAAHITLEKAKLHGLLEVIERDQACLFWDIKDAEAHTVLAWETRISKKIIIFLQKYSYEIKISYFDEFQAIGIHTFIAMLKNPSGNVTVGSASDLDVKSGIERAILEAITLQETVKLHAKSLSKTIRIDHTSLSHVLYAFQNSEQVYKYFTSKVKTKIAYVNITSTQAEFNYKILEEKLRCRLRYYEFPNTYKDRIAVRVVVPTAYRKINGSHNKKCGTSSRLDLRMRELKSTLNENVPYPFG